MQGKNTLTLCAAEMIAALQHYCETKLFKPGACPEVKGVEQTGGMDKSFTVTLEEKK